MQYPSKRKKKVRVVTAARSDGELLLVQSPRSSRWGFPGGIVRVDKGPKSEARHKFMMETGLDIQSHLLRLLCYIENANGAGFDAFLFGITLPPDFFADIGSTGPAGHLLQCCKLAELRNYVLHPEQELLVRNTRRDQDRSES